MKKEREEEECRKLLKEREKMIKEEEEKFKQEQELLKKKQEELKACLEQQIEEIQRRSRVSEELQRKEDEENAKRSKLIQIELKQIEDIKKRAERECALYNIKQHKMRLKKKAEEVQKNLDEERELIEKLNELEIAERIEDELKKTKVKEAIKQFLVLNKEQKNLEKIRQKHLDFLFDSEAKVQYEPQTEFWKKEEAARKELLKDVIQTIQKQIDINLEKNRKRQLEVIQEREEMVKKLEEYNEDLKRLRAEEEIKKRERMKMIDDDVKLKNLKKKAKENIELKRLDEELERVRKEKERLKEEILNIQRRQGPIRPKRQLFF